MSKRRRKPAVGRQVNQMVAELEIESATAAEVRAVAERVCALGLEGVAALARGILRPGPARREKVTALLGCLPGKYGLYAAERLETLMSSRRLTAMERVWLTVMARSLREGPRPPDAEGQSCAPDRGGPAAPEAIDPADLMLWRDDLADLPTAQRRAVLAPVLESGDPAFLPVLDVALSLGDAALDEAIAEALSRFASQGALPLLRELLQRPESTVRRRARDSLVALARQGVAGSNLFVADPDADDTVSRAFATEADASGRMVVAIASRCADGRYRYVVVVLEAIEAGIEQAWGDAGLSESEARAHLLWVAEDHGVDLHPIDVNVARALVAAGEQYARAQGHGLPAEYVVWRRRVGRPSGPVALPLVFGPCCTECGARVRHDDVARGGLVAGDVALCAECAQTPRSCARCGRPLHAVFDEFVVRRGEQGAVAFVCLACERASQGH